MIPLAEVRDRVAADWREARTAEALQKLADGYRDELKAGLALPEIARRLDRPILSAGPLSRGESGPGARPMHPDWARSLRDQCEAKGVPFFFKQWGEFEPIQRGHRRGGDIVVWPDGEAQLLRAAESPASEAAAFVRRVGKHPAGRELDGRTHDAFPGRQTPAFDSDPRTQEEIHVQP